MTIRSVYSFLKLEKRWQKMIKYKVPGLPSSPDQFFFDNFGNPYLQPLPYSAMVKMPSGLVRMYGISCIYFNNLYDRYFQSMQWINMLQIFFCISKLKIALNRIIPFLRNERTVYIKLFHFDGPWKFYSFIENIL